VCVYDAGMRSLLLLYLAEIAQSIAHRFSFKRIFAIAQFADSGPDRSFCKLEPLRKLAPVGFQKYVMIKL